MSKGLTTMKEEKEELFNSKDRFPASAKGGKSLICSLQLRCPACLADWKIKASSNIGYLDLLAGDIRIDFFRPREVWCFWIHCINSTSYLWYALYEARSLGRSKPIPGHCVSPEQLAEKKKLEREPQGILSSRHLGKYFHVTARTIHILEITDKLATIRGIHYAHWNYSGNQSNELKETNRKQQDTLRHILGIDEITRPKREVQHNENEKYVRAKSCMRITTPGLYS